VSADPQATWTMTSAAPVHCARAPATLSDQE
jgi:hypothetical protein